MSPIIISTRPTRKIQQLYALVVTAADGTEGILRRDTPYGTQPWITDDAALVARMLTFAVQEIEERGGAAGEITIAKFRREGP